MLIPDSSGVSRQMSVPVYLPWSLLAAAFILLFGSFFLGAQYFADRVDQDELADLRAENQELAQKYEQLRWDLSETDNRFQQLVQKEVAIRAMFELPEINPDERQLGVGGPVPEVYNAMSLAEQTAFSTEAEVDRMLTLSRYELEKYNEVESLLVALRDRLSHTPSIQPTRGWYSRGYGKKYDPFTGYKQFHRGIDIANHNGTKIIAPANGVIKSVGKNGGMGKSIVITHGYGFSTRYGHLSKYNVKRGQKVSRGDVIGFMGSTGRSTGPHLHYEVWRSGRALNPNNYILNR